MTLQELREKRAKAWEAAKAFLGSQRGSNGLLSAEDDEIYSKMEKEIEDLGREIARLEKAEALDRELGKAVTTPILGTPETANEPPQKILATEKYKNAVVNFLRNGVVNAADVSDTLHTGVDSEGGFLVPEILDSRLVESLRGANIMRQLATVIKTEGTHKINIVSSKPTAAWLDEGEALVFDDTEFDQILLDAHKTAASQKVTEELLYDSAFDLESFLTKTLGQALADKEEEAFLVGADPKKTPTGIFDPTGGGTFGASVATLTGDGIIDLVYSLKRQYRKNACFILNDEMMKEIRKLKDSNGQYIWQPSTILGEPDSLMGYPLHTSQFAPTGAIAFGDFAYYNIGDRGTRSYKRLVELYAATGKVGFVVQERVDGKLVLKEAVQILTITSAKAK